MDNYDEDGSYYEDDDPYQNCAYGWEYCPYVFLADNLKEMTNTWYKRILNRIIPSRRRKLEDLSWSYASYAVSEHCNFVCKTPRSMQMEEE